MLWHDANKMLQAAIRKTLCRPACRIGCLPRKAVLLSGAFQGMAQWFQLVAECMLLACAALEEA